MKNYLLSLLLFGITIENIAQQGPRQDLDLEAFVRNIVGIPTENLNYDELLENFAQLNAHPIDLNKATKSQLSALYLLSNQQIEALLQHRDAVGGFQSIYELQAIETLDLKLIKQILPFVTVQNNAFSGDNLKSSLRESSQYLILRHARVLEQKKGFSPLQGRETVRYLGTPGSLFMRYKLFHAKDISAGFTLEKDDGERLGFDKRQKKLIADFSSIHVFLQNKGRWKNIALGDYSLQLGQGLVQAAGFYLGKGAETILNVRRNSLGIRPYSSVIEQNFLRGAAATYQLGGFELTAFGSKTNRSANKVLDKATNQFIVTSLDTDGYHRTQSELDDKNVLTEQTVGGSIKWKNRNQNFEMEINGQETNFSLPYIRTPRSYNTHEFKGSNHHILSHAYSYIGTGINIFGETARSKSGGLGMVHGGIVSLGKKSDLSLSYRRYDRNFHSFYANGFGEGSRNINEKGLYIGYKFNPNRQWIYTASADFFKFPEQKFGVSQPSQGFEFLQRIGYKPTKTTEWFLQYREQHKQQDITIDKNKVLGNEIKRNLIAHYEKEPNSNWLYSTTLQATNYKIDYAKATYGIALIQNATYKTMRWRLNGRLAYFNAKAFDNRIYAYEQDVLYAFSFPAYYGHGLRHYLLVTYKANRNFDYQLRWSRTDLFNEKTIGSSLDEINKPHRSELKMQVRWSF